MIRRAKNAVKSLLLERWFVPFSPVAGITPAVYKAFRGHRDLVLVDLGAHRGDFTRALMRVAPVERALLVEPIPGLAEPLRREFLAPVFDVEACAAGDADKDVRFNVFPDAPYVSSQLELMTTISGMDAFARGGAERITIPGRKLDTLLRDRNGFARIDLIKLDVQGTELDVLRGASATLDKTRAIWCEVSFRPVYAGACVFADVHSHLFERGFMLSALESGHRAPDGELLQADALYLRRGA